MCVNYNFYYTNHYTCFDILYFYKCFVSVSSFNVSCSSLSSCNSSYHMTCQWVCSGIPGGKVFVNEARMAARLDDLHLDNNNLDWHPDLEQEPWYSRHAVR